MRKKQKLCDHCLQAWALDRLTDRAVRLIGAMQDAGLSAVLQVRVVTERCTCGALPCRTLQQELKTRPFVEMKPWVGEEAPDLGVKLTPELAEFGRQFEALAQQGPVKGPR